MPTTDQIWNSFAQAINSGQPTNYNFYRCLWFANYWKEEEDSATSTYYLMQAIGWASK